MTTTDQTPDDEMTVTQVARLLGMRYHKARDAMLTGKMGETKYPPLTVKRSEVLKYKRKRDANR